MEAVFLRESGCLQGMHEQGASPEDLVAVLVEVVATEGGCATAAQQYDDYNGDDQRRVVLLLRLGGWGGRGSHFLFSLLIWILFGLIRIRSLTTPPKRVRLSF
jgi:hypothetical protein